MNGRKPCLRCLLAESGDKELSELIAERILLIPPDKRADDILYKRRLELCGGCDFLNNATCGKCGCYAELRAAKSDMHCPDVPSKW